MNPKRAILVSLLIFSVFISCSKKDELESAVIENITGEVFVINKNGVKQKAEKGMKIFEGDEIITDKKSSAELSYKKNKIKIYEKSKLSVKKIKTDQKTEVKESEFFLSSGRVFIDSSENIKQKNRITIVSPDSTATSSDSSFSVSSLSGETRIESKRGNIETTDTLTGKKSNVRSGQKISASKNVNVIIPQKKAVPSEISAVKPGVEVPKVK